MQCLHFIISLQCEFAFVSLHCLPELMQNNTCRTCASRSISDASVMSLPEQKQIPFGYFCKIFFPMLPYSAFQDRSKVTLSIFVFIFPQSELSNVSSDCLPKQMQSHIVCTCATFLQCEFSNDLSNCMLELMQSHIGCICTTFP